MELRVYLKRRAASTQDGLCVRQQCQRINRLALAPNLEMQLHAVGIGTAHFRDTLPFGDILPFAHQQFVIVRIHTEISRIVAYHHQTPQPAWPVAAKNHPARRARLHRLAALPGDRNALA